MKNLVYKEDFFKSLDLIKKNSNRNSLIIIHKNPDGDAIGSALALYLSLEKFGRNSHIFCTDSISNNFSFLPSSSKISNSFNINNFDIIFSLDCASVSQMGLGDREKEIFGSGKLLINIDHHVSNPSFGDLNIIEPKSAATACILYFLISELNIKINKYIATCLLTGIYTDTSSFMHDNTTPEVFQIASGLLILGGRFGKIFSNTRLKSIPALKLWGKALSRIRKDRESGIATSVITRKDLDECNASYDDLSGVISLINTVPGIKATLLLSEREGGEIKGSLRSEADGLDVSKVAAIFGGGGHPRASGFSIKGKIEEDGNQWRVI